MKGQCVDPAKVFCGRKERGNQGVTGNEQDDRNPEDHPQECLVYDRKIYREDGSCEPDIACCDITRDLMGSECFDNRVVRLLHPLHVLWLVVRGSICV